VKISELLGKSKHVVANGNSHPSVPLAHDEDRSSEADDSFDMLDGTPSKPYDKETIMKAMKELHRRIERQAENYGGKIDQKTGKIDRSKHKFYAAQIAKAQ